MKSPLNPVAVLLLASTAALSLRAQNNSANDDKPEPYGIRFRLSGRTQFNIKASVTDSKPILLGTTGLFGDGYVLSGSNSSTNAAGLANPGSLTWNWGYNNASQISGDQLTLTRYNDIPRVGTVDASGGSTTFGGELFAGYELFESRVWKRRTAHWGVEMGYGFTTFNVTANGTQSGNGTRAQSLYSLGGIIPPSPGYRGNFNGPVPGGPIAPIIDFTPLSSSSSSALGTDTLNATISSDLHTVKLGPWVDLPMTDKITLGLGIGFCSVFAQADLAFQESLTFSGVNSADLNEAARQSTRVAAASRQDWCPGFYGQARISYAFNPRWSAFGGVDLQANRDLKFSSQDRGVAIELGSIFGASAGVQFSF